MNSLNIYFIALIAITCIFSYKGLSDALFFNKYKFHIGAIRAGEKIRMLSSGFLHGSFMHLLFNMYTLFMFGPLIIDSIGLLNFFIVYFGSLLLGNALSYVMHKNNYNYSAIGASGAVMGIIYCSILLSPDSKIILFVLPMPAYIFGIGYLLYTIYGMYAKTDNIGHEAHFGGAFAGLAITLIKYPDLLFKQTNVIMLMLIPIVLFLILAKLGKI